MSSTTTGKSWSLAARLTLWYATATFLLLLAAGALLFWAMRRSLNRDDDLDMAERVAMVERILSERPQDTPMLQSLAQWKSPETFFEPIFFRVLDANGRIVAETTGMSELLPLSTFPEIGRHGFPRRTPNGRPFRVLATRSYSDYRIQVAIDYADEEKLLARYRQQLALVSLGGLVISGATGYWLARRGIAPVRQMAATIQTIHSTTLHERLDTTRQPSELSALSETFNAMLDRMEDSFARLSQFSADIAHELRTPINNLRGEAEVSLSKPRSDVEYREVLSSCLEECQRLSRLIDNLLFLARAENPKMEIRRERLDVARELETLREFYEAGANEAGVTLALDVPAEMTAELDRTLFQHAIGNLVDNALAYTNRGGTVRLAARQANGSLQVDVTDTGCGIPAAEIPKLFARFHRVDGARARESGGHGLGLTIVKTVVTLHGGSVEVSSEMGVGTRVRLWFPHMTSL